MLKNPQNADMAAVSADHATARPVDEGRQRDRCRRVRRTVAHDHLHIADERRTEGWNRREHDDVAVAGHRRRGIGAVQRRTRRWVDRDQLGRRSGRGVAFTDPADGRRDQNRCQGDSPGTPRTVRRRERSRDAAVVHP